jgi:hypothetical protein
LSQAFEHTLTTRACPREHSHTATTGSGGMPPQPAPGIPPCYRV